MLATTRKTPPETSAHGYLLTPDVNNRKWELRGKGEKVVILCDKEIALTEELRTYLLYFSFTSGKNCSHSLTSFSNIPIKQNLSSGELNTQK